MSNNLPLVAIVGPPNAGKSTLLNKIAKQRLAVTSDLAGTTRDRQYVNTRWNGADFTLVDTAGLAGLANGQIDSLRQLEANVKNQIDVAIKEADVIIFVADGKNPAAAVEQSVVKKFRNLDKPVILAVNKLDGSAQWDEKIKEFKRLGVKNIFPVSAVNGRGIGDMLDCVVNHLPTTQTSDEEEQTSGIAVSIVGKPNVGKSSVFNKILKQERVVVSPLPGTTRTAIDEKITIGGNDYIFIDTAGLKKKEHRQAQADVFSGFQTFKSIRRSDVCLFVLDASEEITKQDQRVAAEIFAMQKGCVILANKCDLLAESKAAGTLGKNAKSIAKDRDDQYGSVRDYISHHFPFLWMCPLFFISALDGSGITEAVNSIKTIYERRNKTIDSGVLEEFLSKKLKTNPPKLLRDQKRPKVFSLHQRGINPPDFELVVNHPAAISQQFRKFLENSIIRELDFYGTPIVLRLKGKDKS